MPLSQDATMRASSARSYLTAAGAPARQSAKSWRKRASPDCALRDRRSAVPLSSRRVRPRKSMRTKRSYAPGRSTRRRCCCAPASGPAADLRELGIAPKLDRQGVGRNLQNHPYLHIALTLPRRSRLARHLRRFAIAGIRLSSHEPGAPAADLLLFLIGRVSPRRYGPDLAMFGAALYAPHSRGAVTLTSADVNMPPRIEFRMFDDPRDPPRMLKAARFAESLLLEPAVAGTYNDAFLLPPVMSLHQFNRPGVAGMVLASAAKATLNAPPPVSRAHHCQCHPSGTMVCQPDPPICLDRCGVARRRCADGASRRHLCHRARR